MEEIAGGHGRGPDQDQPLHGLLVVRGDAQQIEAVHHDAEKQDAEDRPSDGAHTAEQAGATQDDGGDGIELIAFAETWVHHPLLCDGDEAA